MHSMEITAIPREWQFPMEFLTPTALAERIEGYGLMQTEHQDVAGQYEFLLIGQEDQQAIEITIDAGTYLPKTAAKYLQDSAGGRERVHLEEVRFQWNKPIPKELLVPDSSAMQR